jgi:biotin carboxyl carrier protein
MGQVQDNELKDTAQMKVSDLLEQFGRFDENPSSFLVNLLDGQCFLGKADAAAILVNNKQQQVDVLAVYPQLERGAKPPLWLTESAKFLQKQTEQTSVLIPLAASSTGTDARSHIAIVPLKIAEINDAFAVFHIADDDEKVLDEKFHNLQLIVGVLNYSEARFTRLIGEGRLRRLQQSMEILSALNQQDEFTSAAMALCNEVASQWQCQRVSLGFLKGRYVQTQAISHTEDFSRKMKAIQDIESAMEECMDQDAEVVSPALDESNCISRAADQLAKKYGLQTVLSLPLRHRGHVIAVVTLERPVEKVFSVDEIEAIRLTCELCTARLKNLYESNRWIGATISLKTRDFFANFLGPKHTFAKVVAILCFAAILFVVFVKGNFRPKAPFILEAIQQQVIPAPFDGYIKTVAVEVGDSIESENSILATLDDAELRLQLAASKAEKAGYLKQESAYMRDNETAQAQIARANADKAQAQIDLLNYQIGQAKLISPINGIVVKGDLKRQIGAPVKAGNILFEVCPLESLRAELLVPEDLIFDIELGQEGRLATASYPGQPIKFVVERINPMAEVVNQRNVFKVRVRLLETYSWMRPGMEGVAKVSAGKRSYIWIWTRKITNWIRMKFWL